MASIENRRSFRIKETVYVQYEVLSEEEFHGGIDRWRIQRSDGASSRARIVDIDARLDEKLFMLKKNNQQVAEFLELLNEKVDLAMQQLPAFREQAKSLTQEVPGLCEISADGMVFPASEPLPAETKLVLRLLLETDSRYVETFCRVVRTTQAPDATDASRPVGIAVEFLGMSPAQKEILIQHLFSRQSETLRIKRLELDA